MENLSMMPMFLTFLAIGAIGGMAFFYRKKMGLGNWEKKLKVIDRMPIDRKNGLLLVKVEDTELLIGVSGNGISRLMTKGTKKHEFKLVSDKIIPFPVMGKQLRA